MGILSISQLKDKKEMLLRKDKAKMSLLIFSRQKNLERKRLKAEINALENPTSTTAKRIARKIGIKSAKVLFRGGLAIGRHLNKVAMEQNMAERKAQMKRKTTRKKTKRKATKRKSRRK